MTTHRDALGGLPRRTWPYGTMKKIKVDRVFPYRGNQVAICVSEDEREGYVLFGSCDGARAGMTGEIVFCSGGPTGGYWHFTIVHACPEAGSGVTPCCGRTPMELHLFDRITVEEEVTCRGPNGR